MTIQNLNGDVFHQRTIHVDGETNVEIDVVNDMKIQELDDDAHFFVIVESQEELTGNFKLNSPIQFKFLMENLPNRKDY